MTAIHVASHLLIYKYFSQFQEVGLRFPDDAVPHTIKYFLTLAVTVRIPGTNAVLVQRTSRLLAYALPIEGSSAKPMSSVRFIHN